MRPMVRAYLEAALWTGSDDEGEPLNDTFSMQDFAPEAEEKAAEDCEAFEEKAGSLLDKLEPEQVGHDFWLTRNGHGTGFWDRNLGKTGDELSKIAKKFGEADVYVGDDEQLYLS